MIASLQRFLTKLAYKFLSFFKALKGCVDKKDFMWMDEAKAAFQELKSHICSLPTLAAPERGEIITIYLSTCTKVVSDVLIDR